MSVNVPSTPRRKGREPEAVVRHPQPLWCPLEEPRDFAVALDMQMNRHGDTAYRLHKAILASGGSLDYGMIQRWRRGAKTPLTANSLAVLKIIEDRYRLPDAYFSGRLERKRFLASAVREVSPIACARKLTWHLPDDFGSRPRAEQADILQWVETNIYGGDTAYRRYHKERARHPYALNFDPSRPTAKQAPQRLQEELEALVRFKADPLTPLGCERFGVWGPDTIRLRQRQFGFMFGALAANPDGASRGLGVRAEHLTFGLLLFPEIWDWFIRWRERRRGFHTIWEAEMLALGGALTRPRTGWLRQSPSLGARLRPLPGVVSEHDIAAVQANWGLACDRAYSHTRGRAEDVKRVRRRHRDSFEAILPVLNAPSPVGEYFKIAEEIVRRMPDARRRPLAAAEAVRGLLMLRLGLHLGLRAKNLRELLVCPRGAKPRSERELETRKRGELRWSERTQSWEVFIPCCAFKNGDSRLFSRRPHRAVLPDVRDLYHWIDVYLSRHRARLLRSVEDPGVFFIRSFIQEVRDPSYTQSAFYQAWQTLIRRYGIHNPWTGRGAIQGLKTHGPHSVRDVLATHVLKSTGSYEQAGFAIQDSPQVVAAHYARFAPEDKTALAARVFNAPWSP